MKFIDNDFVQVKKASNKVIQVIKKNYAVDEQLYPFIKGELFKYLTPLRSDLNVFIEYPYVDKVYRDTYYHYFSTKYKDYNRDCIRMSFFSEAVKKSDLDNGTNIDFIQSNFLGYCVLRPTFPNIIGRNLISKEALKQQDFKTCTHEANVLVYGLRLYLKGFPHSSQDNENITCAETTIWALMEYFGHKYAEYRPVLPSNIISKLDEYSDKRLLPSNGLTTEQISFALKDFGFGTMIYTRIDDKKNFMPNLSVYIESGFPVIAALENKKIAHAILVIGRQEFSEHEMIEVFKNRGRRKIIPFSGVVKKYIVQDDNLRPYTDISLTEPGENYKGIDIDFLGCQITAIIVPLYRKMYLDVQKARLFFDAIAKDPKYGINTKEAYIFRMYMASSRSFKEHIAKQHGLDPGLKNMFLSVALPRFIWCGEYINEGDATTRTVSSLIVLDATEASENWDDSFIFAAHKKNSLFYVSLDHSYRLIPLDLPFGSFKMFEHNLN